MSKFTQQLTIRNLLNFYTTYNWGLHPQYHYNRRQAQILIKQCPESSEYLAYKSELLDTEIDYKNTQSQIAEIVANRIPIVLKNSQKEYANVIAMLKEREKTLRNRITQMKRNGVKSKYQMLEPVYESMREGQRIADAEREEYEMVYGGNCSCGRDGYCEC